jgi:hypothetical protein
MSIRKYGDQGFDDFRKERKRMQAKLGPQASTLGYENHALRELEQVEAKEVREQQLTREVHDFFSAATRQAASIVEKVAQDAMQATGERVEQQMEAFLIDSIARMNSFVMAVLNQRRGSQVAEAQVEPSLGNLPGALLDEFRWEGTTGDQHTGQDPFATEVEDVQREFRAQVPQSEQPDQAAPIDQHLVAAMEPADAPEAEEHPAAAAMPAPSPAPARATAATATPVAAAATTTAAAPAAAPAGAGVPPELEQFKGALKALVRQGVMSRDEARAAWEKRLQSLGLKA